MLWLKCVNLLQQTQKQRQLIEGTLSALEALQTKLTVDHGLSLLGIRMLQLYLYRDFSVFFSLTLAEAVRDNDS